MKLKAAVFSALSALTLTANAQRISSAKDPPYTVVDRGPFWRTWQRVADGTMLNQPVVIRRGTAYFVHSSGQWGDYSFTTVDPVDNQTIWTIQEYGATTIPNYDWGDWIISVKPGP